MFFVSFSMILPSVYWLFEGHNVLKNCFWVSPSEKLVILWVLGTTVKDYSLAPPTDRSTGVHSGGFSHVLAVLWGSFRYLKSGSGDPAVFVQLFCRLFLIVPSSPVIVVPLCVLSGGPLHLPHHHVLAGQEHPISL